MSKLMSIGFLGIVVFSICVAGYFLLEIDKWEWLIAKKQVNQFAEFDYDGMDNDKPDRIECMKLQTKFIENNNDNDLKLGFRLIVSLGKQESKTIKTSFPECQGSGLQFCHFPIDSDNPS